MSKRVIITGQNQPPHFFHQLVVTSWILESACKQSFTTNEEQLSVFRVLTSAMISAGTCYSTACFQNALRLSDVNRGHQSALCVGFLAGLQCKLL